MYRRKLGTYPLLRKIFSIDPDSESMTEELTSIEQCKGYVQVVNFCYY